MQAALSRFTVFNITMMCSEYCTSTSKKTQSYVLEDTLPDFNDPDPLQCAGLIQLDSRQQAAEALKLRISRDKGLRQCVRTAHNT